MNFVLLIIALVGLVWGAWFVWRGSLLAGCAVFLVVGYCIGREVLRFDVGPMPMTLERPLVALLIVAYVFRRATGTLQPPRIVWSDVVLVLLGGLLTASTFAHDWTYNNYDPVYRLVAGYLMPIGLFFVLRGTPIDERRLKLVYVFLTGFGVYLGITALAEVTGQWWAVFPRYIADPSLGIHFGRARGPALQSQSLGLYLGVCLAVAWAVLHKSGRGGLFVLGAIAALLLAALFATHTRSVWIGAALVVSIVLWHWLRGAWRPLAFTGIALAGVMLVAAGQIDVVEMNRAGESTAMTKDSVDYRKMYAHVSWQMFQDRPLLGHGAGQFAHKSNDYLADPNTPLVLRKIRGTPNHNTLLNFVVETGLVGASLFVALLVGWGLAAWRLVRHADAPWLRTQGIVMLAALAMYLPDAMFHGLSTHQDHYLMFFLAGVTASLRSYVMPPVPREARATSPLAQTPGTSRAVIGAPNA